MRARLRIGPHDLTRPIPPGARAVTFEARLPAGPARLQTWFQGAKGLALGAYYVEVKRLG